MACELGLNIAVTVKKNEVASFFFPNGQEISSFQSQLSHKEEIGVAYILLLTKYYFLFHPPPWNEK